jgi:CarboxypepD_reg-like domain
MKTVFLLLLSLSVFAQTYTVSGTVKDSTQKPVSMVSVFVKNGEGTVTNDEGAFVLRVSKLPVQIVVSHISYQTQTFIAKDEATLTINFKENITTLPEAKVGNYALELLKKAIDKTNGDSSFNHFGRGFYRKIQTEGDKYTVLQELFFNANINGKRGSTGWQPTASRYTFHDGNVENRGIIYYVLRSVTSSPRIRFLTEKGGLMPINDLSKNYIFEIENLINPDTPNEIAVILCTPRQQSEHTFTGRFYIKTLTNGVQKITGRLMQSKRNWPSGFWFKVKENYIDLAISYQEDANGVMLLSGMDMDFVVMVQYASSVNRKVMDHVNLVMYEYDKPKDGEQAKLLNGIGTEAQIFESTQESPEFWTNNPIIKRTPLEDKVIHIFESRKKKGGTMFPSAK